VAYKVRPQLPGTTAGRHTVGCAVGPMIRANHVGVHHHQHAMGQSLFDTPAQCAGAAFWRKTQDPL